MNMKFSWLLLGILAFFGLALLDLALSAGWTALYVVGGSVLLLAFLHAVLFRK